MHGMGWEWVGCGNRSGDHEGLEVYTCMHGYQLIKYLRPARYCGLYNIYPSLTFTYTWVPMYTSSYLSFITSFHATHNTPFACFLLYTKVSG